MDYQHFSRRQLQVLCRKHSLPANCTNMEMMQALQKYDAEAGKHVQEGYAPKRKPIPVTSQDDMAGKSCESLVHKPRITRRRAQRNCTAIKPDLVEKPDKSETPKSNVVVERPQRTGHREHDGIHKPAIETEVRITRSQAKKLLIQPEEEDISFMKVADPVEIQSRAEVSMKHAKQGNADMKVKKEGTAVASEVISESETSATRKATIHVGSKIECMKAHSKCARRPNSNSNKSKGRNLENSNKSKGNRAEPTEIKVLTDEFQPSDVGAAINIQACSNHPFQSEDEVFNTDLQKQSLDKGSNQCSDFSKGSSCNINSHGSIGHNVAKSTAMRSNNDIHNGFHLHAESINQKMQGTCKVVHELCNLKGNLSLGKKVCCLEEDTSDIKSYHAENNDFSGSQGLSDTTSACINQSFEGGAKATHNNSTLIISETTPSAMSECHIDTSESGTSGGDKGGPDSLEVCKILQSQSSETEDFLAEEIGASSKGLQTNCSLVNINDACYLKEDAVLKPEAATGNKSIAEEMHFKSGRCSPVGCLKGGISASSSNLLDHPLLLMSEGQSNHNVQASQGDACINERPQPIEVEIVEVTFDSQNGAEDLRIDFSTYCENEGDLQKTVEENNQEEKSTIDNNIVILVKEAKAEGKEAEDSPGRVTHDDVEITPFFGCYSILDLTMKVENEKDEESQTVSSLTLSSPPPSEYQKSDKNGEHLRNQDVKEKTEDDMNSLHPECISAVSMEDNRTQENREFFSEDLRKSMHHVEDKIECCESQVGMGANNDSPLLGYPAAGVGILNSSLEHSPLGCFAVNADGKHPTGGKTKGEENSLEPSLKDTASEISQHISSEIEDNQKVSVSRTESREIIPIKVVTVEDIIETEIECRSSKKAEGSASILSEDALEDIEEKVIIGASERCDAVLEIHVRKMTRTFSSSPLQSLEHFGKKLHTDAKGSDETGTLVGAGLATNQNTWKIRQDDSNKAEKTVYAAESIPQLAMDTTGNVDTCENSDSAKENASSDEAFQSKDVGMATVGILQVDTNSALEKETAHKHEIAVGKENSMELMDFTLLSLRKLRMLCKEKLNKAHKPENSMPVHPTEYHSAHKKSPFRTPLRTLSSNQQSPYNHEKRLNSSTSKDNCRNELFSTSVSGKLHC